MQSLAKFMINPMIYTFIGLFYILFKLKRQRRLVVVMTIYLYLVSIPLTGNLFWSAWETNDSYRQDKVYDASIVLGGRVDHNWYFKQKKYTNLPFDMSIYFQFNKESERIYAGIEFVKSGNAKNFLYSNFSPTINLNGGYESFNVSKLVRRFVVLNGVPEKNVIIYGNGVSNTVDEAVQFKVYSDRNNVAEILLITSGSHMRRAKALFRKQEITFDTFSVMRVIPIKHQLKNFKNFIPSHDGTKLTKSSLYELVGYIGYFLLGDL